MNMFFSEIRNDFKNAMPAFVLLFVYGVVFGFSQIYMNDEGKEIVNKLFVQLDGHTILAVFLFASLYSAAFLGMLLGPQSDEPHKYVYWASHYPLDAGYQIISGLAGYTLGLGLLTSYINNEIIFAFLALIFVLLIAAILLSYIKLLTKREFVKSEVSDKLYRFLCLIGLLMLSGVVYFKFFM